MKWNVKLFDLHFDSCNVSDDYSCQVKIHLTKALKYQDFDFLKMSLQ